MVGPVVGLRDEQPADVFGPRMLDLLDRGVFTTTDAEESITGLDEFVSLWTADLLPTREHLFLLGAVSLVPPYARAGMLARAGTVAFDELLTGLDSPMLITHRTRRNSPAKGRNQARGDDSPRTDVVLSGGRSYAISGGNRPIQPGAPGVCC